MTAIAEGKPRLLLTSHQSDIMQGYLLSLFSNSLPAEAALAFVQGRHPG